MKIFSNEDPFFSDTKTIQGHITQLANSIEKFVTHILNRYHKKLPLTLGKKIELLEKTDFGDKEIKDKHTLIKDLKYFNDLWVIIKHGDPIWNAPCKYTFMKGDKTVLLNDIELKKINSKFTNLQKRLLDLNMFLAKP